MLGFLAGAAMGGNKDAGDALAGLFIGMIVCIILAIVVGSIFGISQWVTSEPVSYETKIISTDVQRDGYSATYTVEFINSLGENEKASVSYKEYKICSENIGECILVEAKTSGVFWKSEKGHKITLKNNLVAIESIEYEQNLEPIKELEQELVPIKNIHDGLQDIKTK